MKQTQGVVRATLIASGLGNFSLGNCTHSNYLFLLSKLRQRHENVSLLADNMQYYGVKTATVYYRRWSV